MSDNRVKVHGIFESTANRIREHGWHHESECDGDDWDEVEDDEELEPPMTFGMAVAELHEQAHGLGPVRLCGKEPCRRLQLEQLETIPITTPGQRAAAT